MSQLLDDSSALDLGPALVLRPDVGWEDVPEDTGDPSARSTITFASAIGGLRISHVPPPVVAAIRALAAGPVTVADLFEPLTARQQHQLRQVLDAAGHLTARSVLAGGGELARIEATTPTGRYRPAPPAEATRLRLSKFALCRRRDDALVLESPLTMHRAVLTAGPARAVVGELAAPTTAADLRRHATADCPAPSIVELLAHLIGAGFLDTASTEESDGFPADADPVLRQWDFHDLLFHSRSRRGRYDDPSGGYFPYRGQIDPRPAVKEPPIGPGYDLARPTRPSAFDQARLGATIESRHSIRQQGREPLSADELGAFLFRVHRVRGTRPISEQTPYAMAFRPYPGGGGAWELELYLTVQRCSGLEPGIYYYDPSAHRLILVNDRPDDRQALLSEAVRSTGTSFEPDVLITICSRFQRLSWKYRSIAYATTLRNTGVLYQTMYLVATGMGLAPCGIGAGDSERGARILGLDYLQESPVGEFLLSRR